MFAHSPSSRGFSLAETLLVVVVIGLLGSIVVGGYSGLLPAGRQEAAVGRARVLNAARCAYALVEPDAASLWEAAADDRARFQLLLEARVIDGSASDFLQAAGGYQLRLEGEVRSPTVLLKDGSPVGYQS